MSELPSTTNHSALPRRWIAVAWLALLSACSGGGTAGQGNGSAADEQPSTVPTVVTTVDKVAFGDAASEAAHALAVAFAPVQATVDPIPSADSAGPPSEVVAGEFGLTARRLLPRTPNADYYGGELRFTMAVDPVRQNYFTLKFWGGVASASWLVLEVNGLEVGSRHMVQDESMLHNSNGWLPGRFIYRTVRLPWQLTRGQTSVNIRVRSLGTMTYYASGYDAYQKRMNSPSVALYGAYTHLAQQVDVAGETQGAEPAYASAVLPTADEEAAWTAAWKARVNSELTTKRNASAASLTADDLDYLAQGYLTPWTTAYQNAAVVAKVVAAFDAKVTAYAAAPTTYLTNKFPDHGGNGGWGGNFGQVGAAIVLLWPQLQGQMDASVAYGGSLGTTTRRAAWATALRASLDFGRFNRRTISNQEIDAARRIYFANAGLRLVDVTQALEEAEARRYLYEAYGAAPFMGNDQPGGGAVPVRGTAPYGPNWTMTTTRGTTKEGCLVGGDYGEQGATAVELGLMINDATLKAQGLKMLRARAALRLPGPDASGRRTVYAEELIGCRNDHESNSHVAYLTRGADAVLLAKEGVGGLGADLLGYVQEQADDGQLLTEMAPASAWINGYAGWAQVVAVPDAYAAFKALPRTGSRLPMGAGQPDFAWADEENMVIAARHGEERLWANLYWRGPDAINRLARVHLQTPRLAQVADVSVDDVQYTPAGTNLVLDASVDDTPPYGYPPPDAPVNANNGLVLPVALRPDLSVAPATNRDAGRGTAYTLRYGPWLMAINAHPTQNYTMRAPSRFTGGVDLISGTSKGATVTLAPKSAVVFYLEAKVTQDATPANTLGLRTVPANGAVVLDWDAAPGAARYRVLRATAADGPYTQVATVTGTTLADRGVVNGTRYVYAVQTEASDGTAGGLSPLVSATPLAGTLPAPWADVDIGAASQPGSAILAGASMTTAGATLTMASSSAGLFGNADALHFAFVPLVGDGTLTARVVSQANTAAQAHAAVAVRESLAPGARHVSLAVTPTFGIDFRYRTAVGGATGHSVRTATLKAPYWVRVVRTGDLVSGFVSADGVTWVAHGTQTLTRLNNVVYVGLELGNGGSLTATGGAVFDNIAAPELP